MMVQAPSPSAARRASSLGPRVRRDHELIRRQHQLRSQALPQHGIRPGDQLPAPLVINGARVGRRQRIDLLPALRGDDEGHLLSRTRGAPRMSRTCEAGPASRSRAPVPSRRTSPASRALRASRSGPDAYAASRSGGYCAPGAVSSSPRAASTIAYVGITSSHRPFVGADIERGFQDQNDGRRSRRVGVGHVGGVLSVGHQDRFFDRDVAALVAPARAPVDEAHLAQRRRRGQRHAGAVG